MEGLWAGRNGRLSYQVLQEYYVTVTSKLPTGRVIAPVGQPIMQTGSVH